MASTEQNTTVLVKTPCELQAIAIALYDAEKQYSGMKDPHRNRVRFELFADSTHALQKIRGDRECESHDEVMICREILESLRFLLVESGRVHMFWVPAHKEVSGNERADNKAGDASTKASKIPGFPITRKVIFEPLDQGIPNPDREFGLAPLFWSAA
ncbi:hypothetical protein PTNB73_00074 [Pyrenophora teres f. teres]|uniref:RNase H domain containing protein n=1 Tax=Pyrenophora teres f. teres TaxID=97479 RepID=A0A6S6VC03_9PLEO|nr:hypothetical protein HRS9139_01318 [Pyrenophora teres f. teres]KAE8850911.1 hypothetical protein PTNB85_01327 [Pyrenophora teres f. teres]KAE8851057.1 hypothetical protein HRS9122_01344 [Pyrenophora teres f. teres]KAE8869730.1 hypothetical protein PTNB29_00074 [Pyrenophora teres f. teres]KAE8873442.1 hypothetical protein PTNB73_00074 [Pyrenophora teres f. teres]